MFDAVQTLSCPTSEDDSPLPKQHATGIGKRLAKRKNGISVLLGSKFKIQRRNSQLRRLTIFLMLFLHNLIREIMKTAFATNLKSGYGYAKARCGSQGHSHTRTGKQMNAMQLAIPLFAALVFGPSQGWAKPILGSELSSFAVLGASAVTNVPTSTVAGNVGVWSSGGANAIAGFKSSPGAAFSDLQVTGGQVFAGSAVAQSAQGQLTNAITYLGLMGAGAGLGSNLTGLTLTPGVYSVSAGASNLAGKLTLDGQGNANAAWVFQMESSLITSPDSMVSLINTGSDAGVFWDVRSSASLGTNTAFLGNILALTSVNLDTGASMGCGGAYANTGAVTMSMNAIGIGCGGGLTALEGSSSHSFLPFAAVSAVPEPGTYGMMLAGLGMLGFTVRRKKKQA